MRTPSISCWRRSPCGVTVAGSRSSSAPIPLSTCGWPRRALPPVVAAPVWHIFRGAMRRAAATDPLAGGPRALLVGGAAGTAALLVLARGLGLLTTLVLAAVLGASGY